MAIFIKIHVACVLILAVGAAYPVCSLGVPENMYIVDNFKEIVDEIRVTH